MSRARIKAGEAYVNLGVRSKLKQGLAKASARLKAFGAGAARIGGLIGGGAAAIGAGFLPAIAKASEFQERFSKFNTVFGEQAKGVKAWGDEFAGQVGRSKSEIVGFLASTQDLLVPLGLDPTVAAETSKQITTLATDLASFNNMSDADAIRDIQAALTGSGEVMKKYGVIVSQASVKQRLLNDGLDPTAATEAQKAMARLAIIMDGTTSAQGDAVRTSGSFANQMKALKASGSDFLVAVGTPLLDMLAGYAGVLSTGVRAVTEFVTKNQGMVKTVAAVVAGAAAAGGVLIAFGTAASVAGVAVGGIVTAAGAVAAVFGAVLSPVGLVATAIVGATAAFFTFTETGRNVVDWFTGNFSKVYESVTSTLGGISDALQAGDMALAAEIGFTAVKLAIASIMDEIERIFGVSFEKMFQAVAELAKSIAQVVGQLNQARQEGVNFLSSAMSGAATAVDDIAHLRMPIADFTSDEFKTLAEDNARASKRAADFANQISNFDVSKFGVSINDALDTETLSAKLEALKAQAAEAKEAATPLDGPSAADPFSIETGAAKLKEAARASFANFVGLNASAALRSGPGAKGIDKKILDESEKQTELLEQIRDKPTGVKFS